MRLLSAVILLALAAGCGTPKPAEPAVQNPPAEPVEVSFSKDVQPIFAANCLACHDGTPSARSRYDLSRHEGVLAKVVAGRADSSRLYAMLYEGKMPPSGSLDAAKLAAVKDWIDRGAKNN